jgi:uncharacterized protein (TIGR03435 family)
MKRAILGIIVMYCVCRTSYSQPANRPVAFEVASVKPGTEPKPVDMGGGRMAFRAAGCTGGPGTSDPGRLTCQNTTLANLVSIAYNLKRYQFASSFPGWMEEAHFDVIAKIPAGATREEVRLMEQNLLAERFKLAVHFDKKEMQVFELTIGKNGPKLKESPPTPDQPADGGPSMPSGPGKLEHDKDGFVVMPRRSGGLSMSMRNGRIRIQANDQTMEQFASLLTNQLGKPVTDLTGLTGKYDITLTCSSEGMGMMSVRTGSPGAADATAPPAPDAEPAPTLMEAVQQQLGLKLEQKKGTVDILVVDHADKTPVEN